MQPDTAKYNASQEATDRKIWDLLAQEIDRQLREAQNKAWHAHPVWFLDENPVVGYQKLKYCVRLLFWSGQSFQEEGLKSEGSFKAVRGSAHRRRSGEYTASRKVACEGQRHPLGLQEHSQTERPLRATEVDVAS